MRFQRGEDMAIAEFDEFLASFWMNVRLQEDNTVSDQRDNMLRSYTKLDTIVVIDLMNECPHDLAALMTCAVYVSNPVSVRRIEDLRGSKLFRGLQTMAKSHALPLTAIADHPVADLLDKLVANREGSDLYRRIALLLAAARTEPALTPYLRQAQASAAVQADVPPALSEAETEPSDDDGEEEDDEDFACSVGDEH